jgi:hypothetical protein
MTMLVCRGTAADEIELQAGSVVRFASIEEGRRILGTRDDFVASLSAFDRSARLRTGRDVNTEKYLKFVSAQVLAWEDAEIQKLRSIFESIGKKLSRFRMRFPERVSLVKTTGKEEGDAAHCRGNAIVLPRNEVASPSAKLEQLLIHELFHIFSRNDAARRKSLYAVVGFKPCSEITLPKKLRRRKITNPDAPKIDVFIEVTHRGKKIEVVPVLLSSHTRYDVKRGGNFFDYLTFQLLQVEKRGEEWVVKKARGRPVLLTVPDVQGFTEQIGRNSDYIIHPEEVLADNFVLLANRRSNVPTPRILEEMKKILTSDSSG